MAKKPRSQRRKKGKSLVGGDGDLDDEGTNGETVDVDMLSEDHTIATLQTLEDELSAIGDIDDSDLTGEHSGDSSGPSARLAEAATERHMKLLDALSSASTITTEKRSVRRENHLRRLFRAVTQYATGDAGREAVRLKLDDAILTPCRYCLRPAVATPSEQYASCRVLEAVSIILGGGSDDYCEAIDDVLRRAVQATGRAIPVRSAALRALTMATFVCGSDIASTFALLDICEAASAPIFRGEDAPLPLRATALDCWGLLSTTLLDVYIAGGGGVGGGVVADSGARGIDLLPLLSECLENSNVELRAAAGECVSLIHESRLNLGIADEEGENITERKFRQGTWEGTEWEVLMDEIKQRVAELSVESGHHMSKKAKKEQRATFREFMATIVDDEPPSETLTFRGGHLEVHSWAEIVQLNFIRHCLQGGFQIQLMTNSTLHLIFAADPALLNDGSMATMSQLEKRLLLSKTSGAAKASDIDLTRRRRSRTNAKNLFLTVDGEDI